MDRTENSTNKLSKLAKGFRKRTWITTKLSARVGLAAVKRQLNITSAVQNEEEMIRVAEKLVEEMDGLKGLIMKFGQIASYVGTEMSPKAQQILARLQKSGTAMEFSAVRSIVEAEFGAPLETLFEDFSPEPIAAASIGQVHRARYQGRSVAIKIQYPGIDEVIRSDLRTVGKIAWALFLSQETQTDVVLEDLQQRLLEECDYRNEMLNQRKRSNNPTLFRLI